MLVVAWRGGVAAVVRAAVVPAVGDGLPGILMRAMAARGSGGKALEG